MISAIENTSAESGAVTIPSTVDFGSSSLFVSDSTTLVNTIFEAFTDTTSNVTLARVPSSFGVDTPIATAATVTESSLTNGGTVNAPAGR